MNVRVLSWEQLCVNPLSTGSLYFNSDTISPVDIMKSKSNPDILKMAAAAAKRSERTLRSKVGFLQTSKSVLQPSVVLMLDIHGSASPIVILLKQQYIQNWQKKSCFDIL